MTAIIETIDTTKRTDQEIKDHYWKILAEKIKKSQDTLKDIPEPVEPTYEQKEFFVKKMKRGFH